MTLKPWRQVVNPRQDLCGGKPLDASEFAVHLDQVRDQRAPADYQDPQRFFARTFLTASLTELATQVIRRLAGEITETSAVFNMATQFGGGKTHALTLLYHLAQLGPNAARLPGVPRLLAHAGVAAIPRAGTAVFVGTEFDSIKGRGGDDGTPLRKTPWGEIAFQLGGVESFAYIAAHDQQLIAPAGDVIRQLLPRDKPSLILLDELMNYASRNRKSGLAAQLYQFIQNLSESARGEKNVVVAVSIPSSLDLEMTPEDHTDYERFKKMLDRVGKAIMLSAESETSEIIRRRLFEWDPQALTSEGRVMLSRDALATCSEYAEWLLAHRQQIPNWFPIDNAKKEFEATYPFHPLALSVFERKWAALPRFQRTRGILRLLALWVSKTYQESYKFLHRDALIGLGTAPLDDPTFRAAMFEQLGNDKLETAITTDIAGKSDSFATRLDAEAIDAIKQTRLHRKIATAIFFESNGGVIRNEATVPEIRLAVAEPGVDIGNVETVLEMLTNECYFLTLERNKYRFGLAPNLNKLLADRRAGITPEKIAETVRVQVRKEFEAGTGVERVYFPNKSSDIANRPVLTLSVLDPEHAIQESGTLEWVTTATRECGATSRTFKSALIWVIADDSALLRQAARTLLAWQAIDDEKDALRLDESQHRQLEENLRRAKSDLRETVWRTYKHLALLGKDNTIRTIDLGQPNSSSAQNMTTLIMNRLRMDGEVEESPSPNFLVRNWSPAFKEWSTKAVRDAFFASPQFPRLLNGESIRDTIARGVSGGVIGYVGKTASGDYAPFMFGKSIGAGEIEISDDTFIITREIAEAHQKSRAALVRSDSGSTTLLTLPTQESLPTKTDVSKDPGADYKPDATAQTATQLMFWAGEVPPQKWMNFYTKVLSKFANNKGLKISINFQVASNEGVTKQKVEETKTALRELGLDDSVKFE